MKSLELWNALKKEYEVKEGKIYPKNLNIPQFGTVEFLENINDNVFIHCKSVKKIDATDDHVWTLESGVDKHSDELSNGDKILVGKTNPVAYEVSNLKSYTEEKYSYDVTTESAHFMVDDIYSHNCRSFLTPYWHEVEYSDTDKLNFEVLNRANEKYISYSLQPTSLTELPDGDYVKGKVPYNFIGNTGWILSKHDGKVKCLEPKVYGRWNRGVVTLNLPYTAMRSLKEKRDFWEVLDEDCELIRKALIARNDAVKKIKAKNAPILWQYGALARLQPEDDLSSMLNDLDYTTISFGYIGLYEVCRALTGKSNTTEEGQELSKKVLQFMNNKCELWKQEDKIPYSIYGTPEESLTEKAANALKRDFGAGIFGVTDHDYVTNSYHVNPKEKITAFDKLKLEGQYLALSRGGAVSYVEATNLKLNIEAVKAVIRYMYDVILYAEINTSIDYCSQCGYTGKLVLDRSHGGKLMFHCPNCGCTDQTKLSSKIRTCGYMGEAAAGISPNSPNMNQGRLADVFDRYPHLQ